MSNPFKLPPAPGNTSSNNNTKKSSQKPNLLESFREQGKSATTGVIGNAMEQIFGTQSSQENSQSSYPSLPQQPASNSTRLNRPPINFAEFLKKRENRIRSQERNLATQQIRQEKLIFSQKEEQAKKEVESIKAELLQIIKTTNGISAEIIAAEQTIMTNTVESGSYHISFFQRIKRLLIRARKNLSESAHWLEVFNQRRKAKGHYWNQVKKSGAKYMLSQERSLATQTG